MIRVAFRAVPGRVQPYQSVWIMNTTPAPMLAGFVSYANDQWSARLRSTAIDKATTGWLDRRSAAEWLVLSGAYGQRRAAA